MSYCRWSTDDFQCDLYCYESKDGYETHIAGSRLNWKIDLPPKVEIAFKNGKLNKSALKRHIQRQVDVMDLMRNENNYERVPIGLAYDGQSFTDDSVEEFKSTLLMLKLAGYQFPDFEP